MARSDEYDGSEHYPCPCGASTYSVASFSTQYAQHWEEWSMDCSVCKKTHALSKDLLFVDTEMFNGPAWVDRSVYEPYCSIKDRLRAHQSQAVAEFWARHGEDWHRKMISLGSKKARYEQLRRLHLRVPGTLETFYRHGADHNSPIQEITAFASIPKVLEFLGIRDPELMEQVRIGKELEAQHKAAERQVAAARFPK